MIERRSCFCLGEETSRRGRTRCMTPRQKLERNSAAESRVARLVNNAHAAAPDALEKVVVRDAAARVGGIIRVARRDRLDSRRDEIARQLLEVSVRRFERREQ